MKNKEINNFPKQILCWGGGDQARVIQPILQNLGVDFDIIIDDTPELTSPFDNIELLHGSEGFKKWLAGRKSAEIGFIIAIGNPYGARRCQLHDYLISEGLQPISFADPSALIVDTATIAPGAQIMLNTVVNSYACLGKQCIVNTSAIIEHDTFLGEGVEIAPGALLCGRVRVGDYSWICANSTVIPRKSIGSNSIVAAGSSVISDVASNVLVAGAPAVVKT